MPLALHAYTSGVLEEVVHGENEEDGGPATSNEKPGKLCEITTQRRKETSSTREEPEPKRLNNGLTSPTGCVKVASH